MNRAYKERGRITTAIKTLLASIVSIVNDFQSKGYRMTLRQLYYQLVSRNIIANQTAEYNKLSRILTDARMYGEIDWNFIEDRIRVTHMHSEWDSIPDLIDSAVSSYRRRRWADQDKYVEVMVEKNALIGVLEPICEEFHVRITPNVGYSSTTAIHSLALRFEDAMVDKKECVLLYFGDHDPSGEDMVRDIQDRLNTFEVEVEVIKVGLTMEQIEEHNLPPNPAKMTDTRAEAYVAEHGESSWELDALPPDVLETLLRESIEAHLDRKKYEAVIAMEEREKDHLQDVAEREFENQEDEKN